MHDSHDALFRVNADKKRFELDLENETAYAEYSINNDTVVFITHTEVPSELEGKGVGSHLISLALTWIKEKGYALAPLCPFTAAYVKRHPEWKGILAPGYTV
jgi:hypothetical protein